MQIPRLETQRLILRAFCEADLDTYAEMCADPEVMRYIGNGQPLSRAESWRNMAMMLGHWQLRGYGMWAVEERQSGMMIGRIGCWQPAQAFQQPFNLAQDALLRVKLLRLGEAEHVLLLTMHHIVADGWSMGVLMRELGTLYTVFSTGQPSPLADLPIQYADFTEWQRQWLQGEVLDAQLAYWQQQLDGAPAGGLALHTDRPRPTLPTFLGAREYIVLPETLSKQIGCLSEPQH